VTCVIRPSINHAPVSPDIAPAGTCPELDASTRDVNREACEGGPDSLPYLVCLFIPTPRESYLEQVFRRRKASKSSHLGFWDRCTIHPTNHVKWVFGDIIQRLSLEMSPSLAHCANVTDINLSKELGNITVYTRGRRGRHGTNPILRAMNIHRLGEQLRSSCGMQNKAAR